MAHLPACPLRLAAIENPGQEQGRDMPGSLGAGCGLVRDEVRIYTCCTLDPSSPRIKTPRDRRFPLVRHARAFWVLEGFVAPCPQLAMRRDAATTRPETAQD
jgi:hypothetical protein